MKSPKILLIEDTPTIQLATKAVLNSLNCNVDIAGNAHTALKMFDKGYDLILLDIGLPDMSGIEVCKIVRRKYPNFKTPIIAHTAYDQSVELSCREAGVDGFVVKPLSLDKFNILLAQWIPSYKKIIMN